MALAPVSVPPGVIKPATPLQAKGRYWDTNLIRWRSGKLLPVGGWQRISESPLASTVRTVFPWAANNGINFCAFGAEDNLIVLEGATYTDVTPAGYTGPEDGSVGGYGAWDYGELLYGEDTDPLDPRPQSLSFYPAFAWTIDNWGEDILAVSSSDGRLLHYAGGDPQALPVGIRTIDTASRVSNVVTITTDDPHDFTAGRSITISGVTDASFNGTFTIVSTPSTTTFTYAQTAADAASSGGTASLGIGVNNRATIVTPERHAVLLGYDGNPRRLAWSDREDYTDWNFSDPTSQAGYLDLDTQTRLVMCAPVREGTLIWTDDEVWLMRFIGLPYVYSCERIGYGCGLIAPRAFATTAGRCIWMGKESFWIYDGGVVKPLPCDVGSFVFEGIDADAGILYTHGSENSIFPEAWFWYPSAGSQVPDSYVCYSYAEGWWAVGSMTRTAAAGAGVFPYPIATDETNNVYFHENGWTAAGVSLVGQRYAETGSLNLRNGDSISFVRQAITDSGYGYAATNLTFYSSFTPDATEYTSGPYTPRSDGYTDVRVTGRDFRVRLTSTQDAPWSIGEMRLNLAARGGR